jgi:hypothetical protein
LAGCGYTLQNSKNPLLEEAGVKRIYVSPIRNESFKPGVENLLYNELVRTLSVGRRVALVTKKEEADAVLEGVVSEASYAMNLATNADAIFPRDRKGVNLIVATEYRASLGCSFRLVRSREYRKSPTGEMLWESGFNRSRVFPGNNQKDEFGTTSPLINESEFDRALLEMAHSMMGDVHESMLAMF